MLKLATKDRSGRIGGRVLDSKGVPVGGAAVTALEEDSDSTVGATVTASNGTFELSLPAQGYRLSAYAPDAGLALAPEPISLEEGGRVERTLILSRGADLDGTFVLTGEITQSPGITGPYEWPMFHLPIWSTRSDTYHIRGLPHGDWTFRAGGFRGGCVDAEKVEFVVRVGEDLTVQAPAPVLEFRPSYRVSGQVLMHGEPLVGVSVSGSPMTGTSGETDVDGRFAVVVPRGTPELYVGLFAPFARPIPPIDGDREVEITVHGAAVGGRVLDKGTGAPVRTAAIFLLRDRFIGWTHSYRDFHRVDGNGRFDFDTLPSGGWTVQIDADGYTWEIVNIDLRDADEHLQVELEPTVGLRVRARDPLDNVVEDVSLAIQRPGEDARLHTDWDSPDEEVFWPSAPLGPGLLTAVADYKDFYFRGQIDNTGTPIDIVLRPTGRLDVFVPEALLPDESGTWLHPRSGWRAQLIGDDGLPVPALDDHQLTTRLELRTGDPNFRVRGIPPGEYLLDVTGPDGFEWTTHVTIRAGERGRVQVHAQ